MGSRRMFGVRLRFTVKASLLALAVALSAPAAAQYEGYEEELAKLRAEIAVAKNDGERAYGYAQTALLLIGLDRMEEAVADIETGKALLRPEDEIPRGELLYTEAYYLRQVQRYEECVAHMRVAQPIYVKNYGNDHPYLAMIESLLGRCLTDQGEYAEAIDFTRRADAIFAKQGPEYGNQRTIALVTLGNALQSANLPRAAEEILRDALVPSRQMPEKHPIRFSALQALGQFLLGAGRPLEAQPLLEEAIREATENPGIARAQLGAATADYANALLQLDRPADALELYQQAVSILEEEGYPMPAATNRRNAGIAADRLEDMSLALRLGEEALAAVAQNANAGELRLAIAQVGIVPALVEAGRMTEAEQAARASTDVLARLRGAGHSQVTAAQMQLGWVLARQGQVEEGAQLARSAFVMAEKVHAEREFELNRLLDNLPNIVQYSQALEVARLAGDTEFALSVMQAIVESDASRAALAVAAREIAQDTELGALLRQRQELGEAVAEADKALLKAQALAPEEQVALELELAAAQAALAALDAVLDDRFPAYRELIQPRPATIAELRAGLGEDEALLVVAESDRGLHTLAVTREGVALGHDPVRRESLRGIVSGLRRGIDAGLADAAAPFDITAAARLHDAILTPDVARLVAGKGELLVVTGDILSALPLTLLVSNAGADVAHSRFLIEDKAVAVVPSLAALAANRTVREPGTGLVAVGAPMLGGGSDPAAGADYFAPAMRSLRLGELAPLPHAQAEMEAVADLLGRDERATILSGAAATESAVKALNLQGVQVLLFATHGLVAGRFDGQSEPALVLTPPPAESELDDGLLTASEAAALDIGADWVILSACDTAAGGRPSAAGYTGLARGFLFAGAKRVVASHWPVRDDISARLSVGIVAASQGGASPAQALREAVLAVKRDNGNPALWAPFMVVAR